MLKRIKIIVAEDHSIVRQGLISLLKTFNEIKIIGEGENGIQILEILKEKQPDIIITDIEMPLMNGYELAKIICEKYPNIKVIFLSMYYSSSFAIEMIENGVSCCLPKEVKIETLIEAIKRVYTEGYYLNPKLNSFIISEIMSSKRFNSIRNQLALNEREIEVLKLICEGKINKEIGVKLHLTPATIDFYRQSIKRKTELSSVAELVKYAIKNGITEIN